MYEEYFGLKEKPFSILPDPEFLYWSRQHDMAYTMLEYGVLNQAGFTVITGDIGCGKTTLARLLLQQFEDWVTVGLLSNVLADSGRLLEWVLMSFNQPFDNISDVALFQKFRNFLYEEYGKGRHTVLIIDEAQNLGPRALEELRMLSNFNADKDQLLQLILIGQPQLRELLQHPSLVQFAQRVSSDFHLKPLSPPEVDDYIDHRLKVAGAERSIFTRTASELVARESHGVPRSINILCDRALVYAYSTGIDQVTGAIVEQVVEDKQTSGVFARNVVPQEALRLTDTDASPSDHGIRGAWRPGHADDSG